MSAVWRWSTAVTWWLLCGCEFRGGVWVKVLQAIDVWVLCKFGDVWRWVLWLDECCVYVGFVWACGWKFCKQELGVVGILYLLLFVHWNLYNTSCAILVYIFLEIWLYKFRSYCILYMMYNKWECGECCVGVRVSLLGRVGTTGI